MDDKQIIDLYWVRAEIAISETASKYGRYCHYIAYHILHNDQDSEECVNDTYLRAWESIPPQRPSILKAFLGTITCNLSLDKYRQLSTEKRGLGQMTAALDELRECLPAQDTFLLSHTFLSYPGNKYSGIQNIPLHAIPSPNNISEPTPQILSVSIVPNVAERSKQLYRIICRINVSGDFQSDKKHCSFSAFML